MIFGRRQGSPAPTPDPNSPIDPFPDNNKTRRPDPTYPGPSSRPTENKRSDDSLRAMLDQLYLMADSYLRDLADRSGGQVYRADNVGALPQAFAATHERWVNGTRSVTTPAIESMMAVIEKDFTRLRAKTSRFARCRVIARERAIEHRVSPGSDRSRRQPAWGWWMRPDRKLATLGLDPSRPLLALTLQTCSPSFTRAQLLLFKTVRS